MGVLATEAPRTKEEFTCDWTVFETSLGWMAFSYRRELLTEITFGHSSPQEARQVLHALQLAAEPAERLPPWARELRTELERVAKGKSQDFSGVKLDLRHLTPLGQQITAACRAIPWGCTLTYKQLAEQVGRPGAARAVGNVMASNRFPLVVPCHRVVGTSGGLGGFSAPGGIETKRWLLNQESPLLSAP